jgi:two-component system, OmpR family, sensor histidine kinase CpxA
MHIRFPLYAKILLWFFLNLLVLAAAFYLVFQLQFRAGMDSFLMTQASERMQSVSEIIASELNATASTQWNEVLQRFSQAYQVRFFLFRGDGQQVAGEPISLPSAVLAKVVDRRNAPLGRGPAQGRGPPAGRGRNRLPGTALPEPNPKFNLHTDSPGGYWIGVRLLLADGEPGRTGAMTLLAMSRSASGSGLFVDVTPWMLGGFAALLFSVLFWLPLVRSITRSISQINQAAEKIAEGRFDARVPSQRRDELGRLGQAINRMTERLAGFVTGQKRFLGDIAHELCSPIARLQVALGILEQRLDEKQKGCVADVREEVQQISDLVNELLSFSKADLRRTQLKLEPVNLASVVRNVIKREAGNSPPIEIRIDESLSPWAEPELLTRAVANLVRNATRYAGHAGPIVIAAVSQGDHVTLTVADSGPGVPESALDHLFDPFFRVEASRSRDTGGVGLGLAIVKTCIEACQGTVLAKNRNPRGLEVVISLKAGPKE